MRLRSGTAMSSVLISRRADLFNWWMLAKCVTKLFYLQLCFLIQPPPTTTTTTGNTPPHPTPPHPCNQGLCAEAENRICCIKFPVLPLKRRWLNTALWLLLEVKLPCTHGKEITTHLCKDNKSVTLWRDGESNSSIQHRFYFAVAEGEKIVTVGWSSKGHTEWSSCYCCFHLLLMEKWKDVTLIPLIPLSKTSRENITVPLKLSRIRENPIVFEVHL